MIAWLLVTWLVVASPLPWWLALPLAPFALIVASAAEESVEDHFRQEGRAGSSPQ